MVVVVMAVEVATALAVVVVEAGVEAKVGVVAKDKAAVALSLSRMEDLVAEVVSSRMVKAIGTGRSRMGSLGDHQGAEVQEGREVGLRWAAAEEEGLRFEHCTIAWCVDVLPWMQDLHLAIDLDLSGQACNYFFCVSSCLNFKGEWSSCAASVLCPRLYIRLDNSIAYILKLATRSVVGCRGSIVFVVHH